MVHFLFDPTEKGEIEQRCGVRTLVEKGSYNPPPLTFYLLLHSLIMTFFTRTRPF